MRRSECWIELKGVSRPDVLAHYAREQATEVERLADCELTVDRVIRDARAPLYSVRLVLDRAGTRTSIDEVNPDEFLAVRDAFAIARMWIETHVPAEV